MLAQILIMCTSIIYANAHCIPCPRKGITISSFTRCDCPLSQLFYDEDRKTCVSYLECPSPSFRNPLPEMKLLAPAMHDALANILKNVDPATTKIPGDIALIIRTIKKRMENVRNSLPVILGPTFGIFLLRNSDLFKQCKGNIDCIIREAMKREDNYDLIFPKLKPIFDKIVKVMYGVFDDLEEIAQKSCGKESDDCPLIKLLVKFRDLMPKQLEQVLDLHQIAFQINKYLLRDFKKQISEGKIVDQ